MAGIIFDKLGVGSYCISTYDVTGRSFFVFHVREQHDKPRALLTWTMMVRTDPEPSDFSCPPTGQSSSPTYEAHHVYGH